MRHHYTAQQIRELQGSTTRSDVLYAINKFEQALFAANEDLTIVLTPDTVLWWEVATEEQKNAARRGGKL